MKGMATELLLEVWYRWNRLQSSQLRSKPQLQKSYTAFSNSEGLDIPFVTYCTLKRFEPRIIEVPEPPVRCVVNTDLK